MIERLLNNTESNGSGWYQNKINREFKEKLNELASMTQDFFIDSSNKSAQFTAAYFGNHSNNQIKIQRNKISIVDPSNTISDLNVIAERNVIFSSLDYANNQIRVRDDLNEVEIRPYGLPFGGEAVRFTLSNGDLIGGEKLFGFQINAAGTEVSLLQSTSGRFSTSKELIRISSAVFDIDNISSRLFGRGVASGTIGTEIGLSGGSQVIFTDYNQGVGTGGHDYITRELHSTNGHMAWYKKSDITNTSSANRKVWELTNQYPNAPLGLSIQKQSTAPDAPSISSMVVIYPTTTDGKIRFINSNGDIYEVTGTLIT